MILQNRLKSHSSRPGIQIVKDYQQLPQIECFPGELNQVFMNILINAIDVLEERDKQRPIEECDRHPSTITIRSYQAAAGFVAVSIATTGGGYRSRCERGCLTRFSRLNLWARARVWDCRFLTRL
jgi:signal transduction histidine kinase